MRFKGICQGHVASTQLGELQVRVLSRPALCAIRESREGFLISIYVAGTDTGGLERPGLPFAAEQAPRRGLGEWEADSRLPPFPTPISMRNLWDPTLSIGPDFKAHSHLGYQAGSQGWVLEEEGTV